MKKTRNKSYNFIGFYKCPVCNKITRFYSFTVKKPIKCIAQCFCEKCCVVKMITSKDKKYNGDFNEENLLL